MSNWPYPTIVAHRGGGNLAPENTLGAMEVGVGLGHKMIEFDVKLSADGQPFLLHDDSLDRTSDSQGLAGEKPWSELLRVDAGSWYSSAFAQEKLPLLSQVAALCRQHGIMANIEIKPTTGAEYQTGRQVALAAQTLWQGLTAPLLSSFSIEALEAAQVAAPELPRGLLLDSWRDDWQALTQRLGCVSLHLNHQLIDAQRAQAIRQAGLHILAYTVNDPARAARLQALGVDMICTDAIDIITL